jgi:hypothetical protein
MCIGLHVKHPLLLSDFNDSLTFSTDYSKILHIKLHENPYGDSRVFPWGLRLIRQASIHQQMHCSLS